MNRKQFSRKKIKRRKERILVIGTVIVCCLIWLFIIDDIFSPKHPNYEYTYKNYTISQGERLWDIAEEELENNAYYKGEDVRQIIHEIEKDNNIGSNIYPGQVIKIRIKKDELSNATDQSIVR